MLVDQKPVQLFQWWLSVSPSRRLKNDSCWSTLRLVNNTGWSFMQQRCSSPAETVSGCTPASERARSLVNVWCDGWLGPGGCTTSPQLWHDSQTSGDDPTPPRREPSFSPPLAGRQKDTDNIVDVAAWSLLAVPVVSPPPNLSGLSWLCKNNWAECADNWNKNTETKT